MTDSTNHPYFPSIDIPSLAHVELPKLHAVKIKQPHEPAIADLAGRVAQVMAASDALDDVAKGSEVALAVGSRGISQLPVLVRGVVEDLKRRGFNPFIVPAMGSHGGGIAAGQEAVLAKLGVTFESVGAPIRATMETVALGETPNGQPVRFDAHAIKAQAIVTIARVKSHTSFDRDIESGLTKMVAIGLGKQEGARNVHRLGPIGYTQVLPKAAELAIAKTNLRLGLAIVENAAHDIVHLEAVPAAQFLDADRRLLKKAKSLLAKLPFGQLDALIVQELGKEISGAGMDFAVTGRSDIRGIDNPDHIFLHKLAVLRFTQATNGNGNGLGMADYMPRDTANQLDLKAVYENSITSTTVEKAKIPIILPSDKAVLQASVATSWALDRRNVRLCQIKNTLALDEVWVTKALLEELEQSNAPAFDWTFNDQGELTNWL